MMALKFMNFYNWLNKYKIHILSILLIIVSVVFLNRLLLKSVVYESDDYFLHATRTANYYLALKQNQFPVRWGPNLNQSYGYPSFNYMYHTPYLVGSLLHILGLSIQQSLNIAVLLALVFGGVFAYLWANSYLKSKIQSIILSLFFIFNPYSLLNVYWRGAIGEIYFYSFIPLFLLSIKKKNLFLIAISTALLVLSHLPSLFLLAPILLIIYLTEFKDNWKQKDYLAVILGGFLGLTLSSWYWVPAIFEQWMIQYQNSSSLSQYSSQLIPFLAVFNVGNTFFSSDNYSSAVNIGLSSLLGLILGFFIIKKNSKIIYWILLIIISLFLLSSSSLFVWDNLNFLQYVQYPWRFTWVIIFSTIMMFIYFYKVKNISKSFKRNISALLFITILISSRSFINTKGFTTRNDFDWYHPATDTGSSFNEHNPIWAKTTYYFPEELMYVNATESALLNKTNKEQLVHKLSELNPEIIKFDGKTISYKVNPGQDIITLHKRLFYPGWEAYLEEDYVDFITNIPQYEGILAVRVPNYESLVTVSFTGFTPLRRASETISLISFFVLVIYLLKKLSQKS